MSQDFHAFLEDYLGRYPEDVVQVAQEVSPDQDVTAILSTLAAQGRDPMLVFERVRSSTRLTITAQ